MEDDTIIDIEPHELYERLVDGGDVELLNHIADDAVFGDLYEESKAVAMAYLYKGHVLYAMPGKDWQIEHNVGRFLIDHPPSPACDAVSLLYQYGNGLEEQANPYTLFLYITGMSQTSQGMGLNSLMGITPRDGKRLASVLSAWSHNPVDIEGYCELLTIYGED